MTFDMMLGACRLRVECADEELRATLLRYYAPALVNAAPGAPDVELALRKDGSTAVVSGASPRAWSGPFPAQQFERALLDLMFEVHPRARVLHAGGFVWRGMLVVLLAPSGAGKSTMTRAALSRGAAYVSDDVLFLQDGVVSGFARSIRFREVNLGGDGLPAFLEDAFLDGYGLRESNATLTPIWWQDCDVRREFECEAPVVVVRVSRGPDSIGPLTEVERLVALHESAIVRAGEYDGSLGPGPGFELCWDDPDAAFQLLLDALELPPDGEV